MEYLHAIIATIALLVFLAIPMKIIEIIADSCKKAITGYNLEGYDQDGYNKEGYDKEGYDREGYNLTGYDRDGYNRSGYDREGFSRKGYDRKGFGRDGYNRKGFDRDGYDRDGFDRDGFDRDGFNARGFNREGLDRNGSRGVTIAELAALQNDPKSAVSVISSPSFNPLLKDEDGDTVLYAACCWQNADIVKALLNAGADPNVVGASGSPLRIAAGLGNLPIVKLLIKHGAHVDSDTNNDTPLNMAIKRQHYDVASHLLKKGANPNLPCGANRETPFMGAAYQGNADLVGKMIEAGADIDATDNDGDTALTYFVLGGTHNTEVAALLLQNGADIDDLYSRGHVFMKFDSYKGMTVYPRNMVDVFEIEHEGLSIAVLGPDNPMYQKVCY
ncbi:MAG: ankyrin repeat domain-containing protein [Eggerthellaceae bacterium]|nr:ankyrin repeat domain-containing protein [Eggerthellaceae bacterium]